MEAEPARQNSPTEITIDGPEPDPSPATNLTNGNRQPQDPQPPAQREPEEIKSYELMLDLSKYILLLATLVATVTYAAGFNPPGGVWQETVDATGQLAGDSIIRTTSYHRYLVFYYCNATAFASSLVIIVAILFLALVEEKKKNRVTLLPLRAVMVLDLLSIMGAYAAGTCRDKPTTIFSSVLVVAVVAYLALQMGLASLPDDKHSYIDAVHEKRLRKVLMLLATFAVSVTYVAGMSTPGGFWDNTENGHSPGDAILKDSHGKRLTVFLCFNALAFVASLLIVVVLLDRKPRVTEAYWFIAVALISLIVSYTAGSCRETDTNFYVGSLVIAVLAFMALLQVARDTRFWTKIKSFHRSVSGSLPKAITIAPGPETNDSRMAAEQARSLVLLLATLAATITYQAGLDPPGGVWPDNGNGHMAGDPILLTVNAKRYKAFFYCNSVAFVASLVAIILVQSKVMLQTHVLQEAMILDLFGLIGAYAAGSSRDLTTSIYAMALAGAVLVYVVIHVVFFTLNHTEATAEEIESVEKRRKRLLLFAVLAATITYQAGLTPPGSFRLQDDGSSGHRAGDPVLLYNFPRRYKAFFYCNTVSFMLSIALIILLVNPHLYRPAIRSYALAVCTAAGMFGLIGAYAAGSTQHLKTSIYIFVLGVVVLFVIAALFLPFLDKKDTVSELKQENADKKGKTEHAKRKYLMLLGILVASVTYQAGLDPPGGAWQHDSSWYDAGNPIMHDNRRPRYLAFFYSNSTSFVASIVVIVMLLPQWLDKNKEWSLKVMNTTIVLDLLALLVAYAAGSSRGWKTSVYVIALIIAVLAYVAIHIMLALLCSRSHSAVIPRQRTPGAQANSQSQEHARNQAQFAAMSTP
ncbi:hypothetical protein CFC21_108601 [Triticum aestivum]|uniref:PGG domain-containing protein n=2 Tax=Triticum aestivum TaxID=4565 RepID=A0A9R1MIY0_WHEAT|nr:uncharacterized protein LOC123169438 [Triticum aestivum]KAF7108053.1 hypothetical protein CFC21_108601 [Triticum aestivum]